MSILSDVDILKALAIRELVITPLGTDAIGPNSVDLRLGPDLLIATPDGFRRHHLIDDGSLRLRPGAFILGATLEHVEIGNDLTGFLAGRSSRAREGIQVEAAGLVDAGWRGQLTVEIVMLAPLPDVRLTLGMGIAQLYVHQLSSRCVRPYGEVGRYQNSRGPVEARAVVGRPA